MVLDLDETLMHSTHDAMMRACAKTNILSDFTLKVDIDHHPVRFYINKRPHVDFFLDVISQWFDLVIYTASLEVYGAGVADYLDNGRHIFQRRFYRQHCDINNSSYTKNLSMINADLSSIFILDNSPSAYRGFKDNAIPIRSWFSDQHDTALLCLLPVLDALRFVNDVRSILSRNLHRNMQSIDRTAFRQILPSRP